MSINSIRYPDGLGPKDPYKRRLLKVVGLSAFFVATLPIDKVIIDAASAILYGHQHTAGLDDGNESSSSLFMNQEDIKKLYNNEVTRKRVLASRKGYNYDYPHSEFRYIEAFLQAYYSSLIERTRSKDKCWDEKSAVSALYKLDYTQRPYESFEQGNIDRMALNPIYQNLLTNALLEKNATGAVEVLFQITVGNISSTTSPVHFIGSTDGSITQWMESKVTPGSWEYTKFNNGSAYFQNEPDGNKFDENSVYHNSSRTYEQNTPPTLPCDLKNGLNPNVYATAAQ